MSILDKLSEDPLDQFLPNFDRNVFEYRNSGFKWFNADELATS